MGSLNTEAKLDDSGTAASGILVVLWPQCHRVFMWVYGFCEEDGMVLAVRENLRLKNLMFEFQNFVRFQSS